MSGFERVHSSIVDTAWLMDRLRAGVLRVTLQNPLLRKVYCDSASRLGFNYLGLFIIYFFLSLKMASVLLVLGPVFLGFPHLVSSYRFLQMPRQGHSLIWKPKKVFRFFLFLTLASLLIRFVGVRWMGLPQLPYGGYEILLSLSVLAFLKTTAIRVRLMAIASMAAVLGLASLDPLAFVGIALIAHNWVGFGHWYFAAKDFKNKSVVILAVILFAAAHGIIGLGYFDNLISFSTPGFLATQNFEIKGWALAPWSTNPAVWNRFVVLYAFGLSMHYFIWLRAIPQSLDEKSVPNSFRASFQKLQANCGVKTTALIMVGGAVMIGLWIFTPFMGAVYFALAMLHGWLELTFLTVAVCSKLFETLKKLNPFQKIEVQLK